MTKHGIFAVPVSWEVWFLKHVLSKLTLWMHFYCNYKDSASGWGRSVCQGLQQVYKKVQNYRQLSEINIENIMNI